VGALAGMMPRPLAIAIVDLLDGYHFGQPSSEYGNGAHPVL
jgi:hypothetical protein